jgi:hypothetical protein
VINFNDVPSGETTVRAAVFRIYGCGDVTVRVKAGLGPVAPFSVYYNQPVARSPSTMARTPSPRDGSGSRTQPAPRLCQCTDGAVTFECPENGSSFAFVLKANFIARPKVAVMMALDQSWSMSFAAGTTGTTRVEVLKDAARKFMELIQQDNGVGLIRFDHNSYAVTDANFPGLAMTPIASGNIFDPGRVAAVAAVKRPCPKPGRKHVGW